MATFETLHNAIRSRFETQVETPQSITAVYDNGPDEHPDDALWVRWTVLPGASNQIELGANPSYRTVGVAVAQIFQPIKQGDKAALELADVIVTTFRAVTDTGVKFLVPSVRVVGRDGAWWQVNVTCPFQCDETP